MDPLVSARDVYTADDAAEQQGVPRATLVARAGAAVAWEARRVLGTCYGKRVLVAIGPGKNGADGHVAARKLRNWGATVVEVVLESRNSEGRARSDDLGAAFEREWSRADLLIDAMFGVGLSRPLTGLALHIAERTHQAERPQVLAVDLPSGIDADTGAAYGVAVRADVTITFVAAKAGLVFSPGRETAGAVRVADIGIPLISQRSGRVIRSDVQQRLPRRSPEAHKWSVGAVLVVGGSPGMGGAPVLAGRAAMMAGAGIVHVVVPVGSAASVQLGAAPELIVIEAAGSGRGFVAGATSAVLKHVPKQHAVVLGPGFGRDAEAVAVAQQLIATIDRPLVIDADGLNALSEDPTCLRVRSAAQLPRVVLTPHDGEFARLTGAPPGFDRVAAAVAAAREFGATVLLKGATTVVADVDGTTAVVDCGSPNLATAGSGDVLSGVIAALIARGLTSFDAACAAAWIHATAGDGITVASDLLGSIANCCRDLDRN